MSDPNTTEPDPAPQEGTDAPETFDADYVRKLRAEAAKYRTEAKANAKAAEQLAVIEAANKTEAEKAAERLTVLEREATTARAEALRFKIAAKFEVSEEDADLFLTGTDEETLTRQAKRLTDRTAEKKKAGNHVPREGTSTAPAQADPLREFTEHLFAPRA